MRQIKYFILALTTILFLIGCGAENNSVSVEKNEEKTEKIEAFIAKSLPYEEGDYKLVNSQTILYGTGENLKVEARIIEDFFDKEGNYIKTRLLYSTTKNGDEELYIEKPMTVLLINKYPEISPMVKELNTRDKEEVKGNILEVFKTEVDNASEAVEQQNGNGKNDEENTIDQLPNKVDLSFNHVELIELEPGEEQESWEYIQSISLGEIKNKEVTLHAYKEKNEDNICSFSYESVSLIEYDGIFYKLDNKCTSTTVLDSENNNDDSIFLLQQQYKNENSNQILQAGIELAANGPGRMLFIIFDVANEKWLAFEDWGIPYLRDLDNSSELEFVIQFPGLHMDWPDVTIYRWNNGTFEMSSKLKEALEMDNHNQNAVNYKLVDGEPRIVVSILTGKSEQIYKEIEYLYNNGTLYKK
jgi:hypothetical protein